GGRRGVERGQHRARHVRYAPAGPEPGAGAGRGPLPPDTDPAQDALLPALRFALAVDRPQPEHRPAPCEIGRFDIELVVVVVAFDAPAQRVPAAAHGRVLGDRDRLTALIGEQ